MDSQMQLPDTTSRIFFTSGLLLFTFGIGEIVATSLLLQSSHGHFMGSMYTGIFSIILGIRVVVIKTINTIYTTMVFFLLNMILCIVGTTLTVNSYYFLHSIEACSSYSSTAIASCQTDKNSHYSCLGNHVYFALAQFCEATYITDHGVPDTTHANDQCACVRSPSNNALSISNTPYEIGKCYSYTTLKDCNDIFGTIPTQLRASVLINIFLLVFTSLLGLYAMYLYINMVPKYQPKKFKDSEVERNLNEYHRTVSQQKNSEDLTLMLKSEIEKVLEDESKNGRNTDMD